MDMIPLIFSNKTWNLPVYLQQLAIHTKSIERRLFIELVKPGLIYFTLSKTFYNIHII